MPPWEKYQKAPAGPWAKYGGASNAPPAVAGNFGPTEPPPNPNFEIQGRSQTAQGALPDYQPPLLAGVSPIDMGAMARGAERALLTNEPTQGMAEDVLRGVPAAIGGAIGGAVGLVAGTPLTAGAAATSIGGAAFGGAAFEAGRQGVAQVYSGLTGRGQVQPPRYIVKEAVKQGAFQAPGQVLNLGTGLLAKYYGSRLPATIQHYFGAPAEATEYVQKRGTQEVFAPGNLADQAPITGVGKATADLAERRAAVGGAIGNSEDFILGAGGATRDVPTDDIARNLRDTMTERGYLDPRTSDLARGKDVSLLNSALDTLEGAGSRQVVPPSPATTSPIADAFGRPITKAATPGISIPDGPLNLRQAVNTKRLIDGQLDFDSNLNREISKPAAAIAKQTNNALRDRVRAEFGDGVSKLYDDFGAIAEAQEKLAEFTGTKDLSRVEQRAVQGLKTILLKNPGEVDNIVQVLGAGLPGGQAQARQIFDSIAAEMFTGPGKGAPSNIILKKAASILPQAAMARQAVRIGEGLNRAAASPSLLPRVTGPAATAIEEEYMRRNQTRPAF